MMRYTIRRTLSPDAGARQHGRQWARYSLSAEQLDEPVSDFGRAEFPSEVAPTRAIVERLFHGGLEAIRGGRRARANTGSIIAAESTVAIGFAQPLPAMSGADPWTGSNSPAVPVPQTRPTAAARSTR